MNVVATIPTWQDGPALDAAIASCVEHVDHVFVVDGIIAGVLGDTGDLVPKPGSDEGALVALEEKYGDAITVSRCGTAWESQAAKGNACMRLAASYRSGRDSSYMCWALMLDADEQLVNGDQLRAFLGPDFTVWWAGYPLPFLNDDGRVFRAPFKLVRSDMVEYVARWIFFRQAGSLIGDRQQVWMFEADDVNDPDERALLLTGPHIEHHPELRPADRAGVRLGQTEAELAPAPSSFLTLPVPPAYLPAALTFTPKEAPMDSTTEYYCDQCGARYPVAGFCNGGEYQHPPAKLQPVPVEDPVPSPDTVTPLTQQPAGEPTAAASPSEGSSAAAPVAAAESSPEPPAAASPAPGAPPAEAAPVQEAGTPVVAPADAAAVAPAEAAPADATDTDAAPTSSPEWPQS